jgi:uncharacterized membrane protein (DUF4010 family)
MTEIELLSRLATALSIGLMVGLERGWQTRDEEDHHRAAGLRTFALTGLLGGVAGALSEEFGSLVLAAAFLGFAGAFVAFHMLEARTEKNFSATGVVAGLLTFLLGAYAVAGEIRVAVAAAVAMTVLLALRTQLHGWVRTLTWAEIRAVLILLAMTFLLLPVLPDRPIDPFGAVNPRKIWMLAIMMAAISFGGYIAVRVLGDRLGVVAAAVAGGLASSTATTLTLSRLGRDTAANAPVLAAGILASSTVMVIRVGVVAALVNRSLVWPMLPALAAAGATLAIAALVLLSRRAGDDKAGLEFTNPLDLGTTLKLAAFIAVVLLATEIVRTTIGDTGVLAVAALSGIADVDAVTISMAELARDADRVTLSVQAIGLAVAVNQVVKSAMAWSIGGRGIGVPVAASSAGAILAGALALALS